MRKVLPLAVVCALLCAPPAFGTGGSSDSKKLRDAVGVKGMLVHEAALQHDRRAGQRQPAGGHQGA